LLEYDRIVYTSLIAAAIMLIAALLIVIQMPR
jgi:hypothetical protein